MKISFSPPDMTELEVEEVKEAILSGWITTGPKTKEFERQIAEYCHVNRAVCLNSQTAYFPILVEQQSSVQKKLAERGIYAPVIWPIPKLAQGVCKIADDIANHMLGIPCDHRYTHEEIKKMAHIITEVVQ